MERQINQDVKTAFGDIDTLNDFTRRRGSLYIAGSEGIISPMNKLHRFAGKQGWDVFQAREDHPKESIHFKDWITHGVRGTWGAQPDSRIKRAVSEIFLKGSLPTEHGYSAASGKNAQGLTLVEWLKHQHTEVVLLGGVALGHCVGNSGIDLAGAGFETYIVFDATRAVNRDLEYERTMLEKMIQSGVRFTTTDRVLDGTFRH